VQNASKSIVGSLADHEKELLAKRDASIEEARELIEQAQAEARKHLQDEENRLNEDVAEKRKQAEAARQQKFQNTVDGALEKLSGVKSSAMSKVEPVSEEVLALFMPKPSGGN
jgi:F0F1-type ATP synthase membrane subunit b/b'